MEEQVISGPPGLTFHIVDKSLNPSSVEAHVAQGIITLSAVVSDLEVWDSVVEKLDGMQLYTGSSITSTLVEVAKRRVSEAEVRVGAVEESARQEIDRLTSSLTFKEQENAHLIQQIQRTEEELSTLKEFMQLKGML